MDCTCPRFPYFQPRLLTPPLLLPVVVAVVFSKPAKKPGCPIFATVLSSLRWECINFPSQPLFWRLLVLFQPPKQTSSRPKAAHFEHRSGETRFSTRLPALYRAAAVVRPPQKPPPHEGKRKGTPSEAAEKSLSLSFGGSAGLQPCDKISGRGR